MTILKTIKSTAGNSLAEFAVVIALMATLMSTGQVKFSQAGEGGKGKKTGEELDKLSKAARGFYNAINDLEGAGRFPGQDKWDRNVPGQSKPGDPNGDGDPSDGVVGDGSASDENVTMTVGHGYATVGQATVDIATNMQSYTDALESTGSFQNWVSVFGKAEPGYAINYTHTNKIGADDTNAHGVTDPNNADRHIGHKEFGAYVDPVKSPFLDGHFIYTVIGGTVKREPALIVTDFYAPADEFLVVQP